MCNTEGSRNLTFQYSGLENKLRCNHMFGGGGFSACSAGIWSFACATHFLGIRAHALPTTISSVSWLLTFGFNSVLDKYTYVSGGLVSSGKHDQYQTCIFSHPICNPIHLWHWLNNRLAFLQGPAASPSSHKAAMFHHYDRQHGAKGVEKKH